MGGALALAAEAGVLDRVADRSLAVLERALAAVDGGDPAPGTTGGAGAGADAGTGAGAGADPDGGSP
jgi:hypothetical protein